MLDINQIRDYIKDPINKEKLVEPAKHQRRVRFHSSAANNATIARKDFMKWVAKILPEDKLKAVKNLFDKPDTIPLTTEIYQSLSRVFDGVDVKKIYRFIDAEYNKDFTEYIKEVFDNWADFSFSTMKDNINSIVIIDLPNEQTTERPEPYFYTLGIENVVDYSLVEEEFDWIIFKANGKYYAYDSTYYRSFDVDNDNIVNVFESEHNLGYCPARFFWSDAISNDKPEFKKSPISEYLPALDWAAFYSLSKRYADLYASYPIYWGYAQECGYQSEHYHCEGGYLQDQDGNYIRGSKGMAECPMCSDRINGVGSFIEVTPPSEETGGIDLTPPVGVVNADINALKYSVDEVKRLFADIYRAVTGNALDSAHYSQAVNEIQVLSTLESQKGVLLKLKTNFEKIESFICKTIAKLRYDEAFEGCSIDYGTDFYLVDSSKLLDIYQSGMQSYDTITLDRLQDNYYKTLYRDDTAGIERAKIITAMDPYRHLSKEEAKEIAEIANTMDLYVLKVNLSALINRFERENGDLVTFAENIERFDTKIEMIRNILLTYINLDRNG